MTRRAGYRLRGMGSREENRQSIQGFNATEEVVPTSVCGNPSLCHPGLDPGLGFEGKTRVEVSGKRLERAKKLVHR